MKNNNKNKPVNDDNNIGDEPTPLFWQTYGFLKLAIETDNNILIETLRDEGFIREGKEIDKRGKLITYYQINNTQKKDGLVAA